MKALLAAFLQLTILSAAAAPLPALERVSFGGNEYVRLREWAAASDLSMQWARNSDTVTLTNAATSLEFSIDSRRAGVNGVTVWLSLPVVNRGGVALVSWIDLRTALQPILHPRKADGLVKTICLDPGHGGKDKGEIAGTNYEKKFALLLGEETARLLEKEGFKVILTRSNDTFIELPDRPSIAQRHDADLFVSLHYNSAERGVGGVETYCLAPAGMNSSNEGGGKSSHPAETGNGQDDRNALLAYEMQKRLVNSLPMEDRGVKRSHFEVLRYARMPAILIEGGFMSNAEDAQRIYDAAFRQRMAQAVVNGILAYKSLVEKP